MTCKTTDVFVTANQTANKVHIPHSFLYTTKTLPYLYADCKRCVQSRDECDFDYRTTCVVVGEAYTVEAGDYADTTKKVFKTWRGSVLY